MKGIIFAGLLAIASSLISPTMMGSGNTRRSAKRKQKNLARVDKALMFKGKLVSLKSQTGRPVLQEDDQDNFSVAVIDCNTARVSFGAETGKSPIIVNTTQLHQRQDKKLWLAVRASLDVTASEFGAVLDKSPFVNRKQLLINKLGLNPKPFTGNAATAWGLRMEPLAIQQYIEVTGNTVEETGLWCYRSENGAISPVDSGEVEQENQTPALMGLGASPDGLVFDPILAAQGEPAHGVLEVKCFFGRRHKKELAQWQHCPNRFYDQIQGQLEVCDRPFCDLFLWIPKHSKKKNYCRIRVVRNQDYWNSLLAPALREFQRELLAQRCLID